MTTIKRNSSFELMKIFAIICIVFCHSVPTERVEYHYATDNPWLFLIIIFREMGSIGNAIFMVASTWFLVDNDSVNLQKLKQMIADNQLISLLFLGFMWFIYDISIKTAIKQIFPFLFSTLWYITCYVLYYCLHGIINRGLKGVSINPKLPACIIIILDLIAFVLGGLYFNDLIMFLLIHSFTWFTKRFLLKKSEKSIIGAVVFNYIGVYYNSIGEKMSYWNRFFNPFILAIAYGLMLLASQIRINSEIINRISSLSLFIYIITGNQLLRYYTDNYLYDWVSDRWSDSMSVCVLFIIVYAIIKFLIGIGLSYIYKNTLGRFISFFTTKECKFISNKINKHFPKV